MGQGGVGRRLVAAAALAALIVTVGGASRSTGPAGAANEAVRGFAIWGNQSPAEYQRIAHTGANTIYLDVYYEADSHDANSVHSFPGNEQDAILIADIQKAANAGLRVVLMPRVWCNDCAYHWRGFLDPSDPHAFMQSYGDMLTHYATLAQQQGVWLFFLGSEMSKLEQYADDWRQVRDRVRGLFAGPITY